MSAYWLTFKPLGPAAPAGWPIENLQDLVRRVAADPMGTTEWWRLASHQSARDGDRVYVFKQNPKPKGIFGFGRIVGTPEKRSTPTDQDVVWRAHIRFEHLVDPTQEFLLPLEAIDDVVSENLVNARASGNSVPDDIAAELEKRLGIGIEENVPFDPTGFEDEREKVLREIHARRGQREFRAKLLEAYGGRCTVTDCGITDVLEAAHLSPYRGPSTNDVTNGILLRADIHTLFDLRLLAIDPDTRTVVIDQRLRGSNYATLSGKALREPINSIHRPGDENLMTCFSVFKVQRHK